MTGIANVWELADPANAGKTFMKDISKESVNKNFLAMLTEQEWADKLAAAYKDYYGKDIELDEDCANAGYQYIKDLLANVTFGSGDGDIATELANGKGGNVGLFVYSKLRDDSVTQENLTVAAYQDTQPEGFSGFYVSHVFTDDQQHRSSLYSKTVHLLPDDGKGLYFRIPDQGSRYRNLLCQQHHRFSGR